MASGGVWCAGAEAGTETGTETDAGTETKTKTETGTETGRRRTAAGSSCRCRMADEGDGELDITGKLLVLLVDAVDGGDGDGHEDDVGVDGAVSIFRLPSVDHCTDLTERLPSMLRLWRRAAISSLCSERMRVWTDCCEPVRNMSTA